MGVDPRRAPRYRYGGGLTGVFAPSRTREAVWEALKARRVCGTTGARILMEFRVDGVPHGVEVTCSSAPRITGHVLGDGELESVELVKYDSHGYTTPWVSGGGTEAFIDFTDRSFREDSFYYLRVTQADGNLGWAGPTWVDKT